MKEYIISCESNIDLPYEYVVERNLSIINYTYIIDEVVYVDDMGKDPGSLSKFYAFIDAGKMPSTTQINLNEYVDYFEKLMLEGKDVLHISFSSAMTGSVGNAILAAKEVGERYPNQRIEVLDSLSASSGYGLLIDEVLDLRDSGKSYEEIKEWVLGNVQHLHHYFYSTDLKYFRRGGRVSGVAATLGAVLNICPMMRIDENGKIIAFTKARGKKNAIKKVLGYMEKIAYDGNNYSGKCWINHSNSPEDALFLKDATEERFPNLKGKIRIYNIGTVIGSHTGPGTISIFYFGDERKNFTE